MGSRNDGEAGAMNDLLDRLERAEAELRQLRRENALLRSGIDPDSEYLDGLALGMNIAFIGEKVGAQLDEVPVC